MHVHESNLALCLWFRQNGCPPLSSKLSCPSQLDEITCGDFHHSSSNSLFKKSLSAGLVRGGMYLPSEGAAVQNQGLVVQAQLVSRVKPCFDLPNLNVRCRMNGHNGSWEHGWTLTSGNTCISLCQCAPDCAVLKEIITIPFLSITSLSQYKNELLTFRNFLAD